MKLTEFKRVKHRKYLDMPLEEGVLYISDEFETSAHLCPCGCGDSTIVPFGEHGWHMTEKDGKITFSPSILNPCGAHYFVRDNKIVWV